MSVGDEGSRIAQLIAANLRDVPDFPTPGILFKDITPLLANGVVFGTAVSALAKFAAGREFGAESGSGFSTVEPNDSSGANVVAGVDLVVGVEARGFVLAGAIARELNCGLVPVRKAGKLPPPTLSRSYELEYGRAEIEVPVGLLRRKRVLLVDDVLATGGTLEAAAELIIEAGGTVVAIGVLLEMEYLGGRHRLAKAGLLADESRLCSLLRI